MPGEISIISICRWYDSKGRNQREAKEPLGKYERGEWKSLLKTQHSKNEDHSIWSYLFIANRWGKCENGIRFHFLGLQNQHRPWLESWN